MPEKPREILTLASALHVFYFGSMPYLGEELIEVASREILAAAQTFSGIKTEGYLGFLLLRKMQKSI